MVEIVFIIYLQSSATAACCVLKSSLSLPRPAKENRFRHRREEKTQLVNRGVRRFNKRVCALSVSNPSNAYNVRPFCGEQI